MLLLASLQFNIIFICCRIFTLHNIISGSISYRTNLLRHKHLVNIFFSALEVLLIHTALYRLLFIIIIIIIILIIITLLKHSALYRLLFIIILFKCKGLILNYDISFVHRSACVAVMVQAHSLTRSFHKRGPRFNSRGRV